MYVPDALQLTVKATHDDADRAMKSMRHLHHAQSAVVPRGTQEPSDDWVAIVLSNSSSGPLRNRRVPLDNLQRYFPENFKHNRQGNDTIT
jgi:hypothetical protein